MGLFSRGNGDKLSEQLVLQALGTVQEPELGGDLVSRKMIKDQQKEIAQLDKWLAAHK